MSLELHRYGRGPDGFPYILTALPDGYWTPWHVADQQIRRLETRVEELEAGQAVGEAEDLRREVDGLRDLLHRMLEAPTTQVSVAWKDAVRQALGSEAGQPAAQADAQPVAWMRPDGTATTHPAMADADGYEALFRRAAAPPARQPQPDYGVRKVDLGFRWDGVAQHHVPQLTIEFTPVVVTDQNDAKGWNDRDALAAALSGGIGREGE